MIELREPTIAERVRTVFARATAAHLAAGSGPPEACRVHHLLRDGSVALTVRNDSAVGRCTPADPMALELLDHGPVAGEDVRALVWVRGRMSQVPTAATRSLLDEIAASNPDPGLLDVGHSDSLGLLTVDSVVFADNSGASLVDHSSVVAARADPFSLVERAWVHHIGHHHPDMVERLRLHLPRTTRRGSIRLIGLDRYGLLVKTQGAEGHRNHRIHFFTPVNDEVGLFRALRSLMSHPFTRGLRTGICGSGGGP